MAFVYQHYKKGTKELFYVGISSDAKYKRAYDSLRRNDLWKKYVNKYGFDVEITHKNITWEEACKIEIYLISFWGKLSADGILVNMTDGGEGTLGRKMSEKERLALSERMRIASIGNKNNLGKKRTEESRLKSSISHMGKTPTSETLKKMSDAGKKRVYKKGFVLSIEHKEKIRQSMLLYRLNKK